MHKRAVAASMTSYERSSLSKALLVIGKDREDLTMIRLARENKTFVSVDDAYAALGAPRDCTDEGLIL
jgi:ubiquitin carboxyl-terminal hydrolase 25/28